MTVKKKNENNGENKSLRYVIGVLVSIILMLSGILFGRLFDDRITKNEQDNIRQDHEIISIKKQAVIDSINYMHILDKLSSIEINQKIINEKLDILKSNKE